MSHYKIHWLNMPRTFKTKILGRCPDPGSEPAPKPCWSQTREPMTSVGRASTTDCSLKGTIFKRKLTTFATTIKYLSSAVVGRRDQCSSSTRDNKQFRSRNNNNKLLHLYCAFLGTESALHRRGESPRPPPVCSIHLDNATAAILRQTAHHTPAYWWRGDRVMKPIGVWGWLGGHDGQRPMGKFGQDAGVTPLLFFEGHPGIFNDHRESGPRFNVSSEGRCFLQYSVPVTILGCSDPHRPQGEHPLLASLTPLPAAT